MSKYRVSEEVRILVEKRAFFRCEYCQSPMKMSTQRFEMEHIVPVSKGGANTLENLALACRGCNGHKFSKTEGLDELSNQKVALFNPRKDTWSEHFAWDVDVSIMLGMTSKGRATIQALHLNRFQLIGVRTLLLKLQLHPPS